MCPLPGDADTTESAPDTHTPITEFERASDYSAEQGRGALPLVIAASQWLHATAGRIATCAHSWMTAVHWVDQLAQKGLYKPARSHGPKWGRTTVVIAQEIAALKECRPGIAYLMRKLNTSERTIQYHLGMLRETGLLVYRIKGTRISQGVRQASVFERIIPAGFDTAHGIRTVGKGVTRRPVGAAPEAHKELGKLAKKAARKTRRRPSRTRLSGRGRCTPMQGGTSASSPTAFTHLPSESKLASGEAESPTPKSQKCGPRKLNKVGRRFQLAGQLIREVPWLHRAHRDRIAHIVRHVSDAGWTAAEVRAAAEMMPVAADDARRPSGLLAYRLASCHLLYTTPQHRRALVDDWRESRAAEQARHTGYDAPAAPADGPSRVSVRSLVHEAFRRSQEAEAAATEGAYTTSDVEGPDLDVETLSREQVLLAREGARSHPEIILSALELMPERDVRRLYTNDLVDQVLALEAISNRSDNLVPAF